MTMMRAQPMIMLSRDRPLQLMRQSSEVCIGRLYPRAVVTRSKNQKSNSQQEEAESGKLEAGCRCEALVLIMSLPPLSQR